jgi:hypothetical protein
MILIKCALKKTSKKPSPIMIPYTGSGIAKQDYYSVNLTRSGHSFPDLLVRKSGKRGVVCKEWVENENKPADGRFSKNVIIPWRDLENAKIETRHYLKGHEYRYSNAHTFLLHQFFHIPYISVFKSWVSQAFYNTRTPARSSRMELLKRLVRRRIKYHAEHNNYQIRDEIGDSVVELLKSIYGIRIYSHPKNDEYRSNLLVDLDSLVATKDVRITNHNYVATGKAVATIAEYEEENRRHIDNRKHNNRIFWLTIALVAVGLLQIPWVQNFLSVGSGK